MSDAAWYYSDHRRQAGPVTADVLREMASSGRLTPQDLVWRDGMGDWRPASTVPEIAASLPVQAVPALPLHMKFAPPAPGVIPDEPEPPRPRPRNVRGRSRNVPNPLLVPVNTSGWAIAAGWLGLLGMAGGCLAPVALVCSVIALHDIHKHPGRQGMGRAVFGLAAGAVGTILFLMLLPTLAARFEQATYR